MLKLYDHPFSGNCYKVRLLLTQLETPFERETFDFADRSDRPGRMDQGAIPTSLRIPQLVFEDGRTLGESNAIISYLAEGTAFVPEDRFDRARVLQWLFFEQYEHEPNLAVARFWVMHGDHLDIDADVLATKQQLGRDAIGAMERRLEGSEFLVGEGYSIADIALYVYTHVAHEADIDLEPFPAVRAWIDRVAAQPRHITMAD